MQNKLVLTPEGSLNWLFDENFLLNLLEQNCTIIMDLNDYRKHRRVALTSELSLVKYFMLTLFNFIGRINFIDYKKVYHVKNIKKNILSLTSHQLIDYERYENDIIDAYNEYISYVKRKKRVIKALS